MRRGGLLGAGLAVLALVGWLASRGPGEVSSADSRERTRSAQTGTGGMLQTLFQSAPSVPAETSLRIRGRVVGARGPVAGAAVLASMAVAGESLSDLPCQEDALQKDERTLLDCYTPGRLARLVTLREGEAPVLARTLSAADGSFSLEGLKPGHYALWGEGAEGTCLKLDVAAGEDGVELLLVAGTRISGVIDGEEGPLQGVLVTAILGVHNRFFESVTDATGHFQLGPIPRGEYTLLLSKAGLHPLQTTFSAQLPQMERSFRLYRVRRIPGRVLREGSPVAGARVRTRSREEATGREVLTDETGHFAFEGLPPWELYSLSAMQGSLGATANVDLRPGVDEADGARIEREGVTLELGPMAEVQGVVRDVSGQPIPGAGIHAWQQGEYASLETVSTDAEGHYRLGPFAAGLLRLEVQRDGYFTPKAHLARFPTGVSTLDFTLLGAPRVDGILVDVEGQPVAEERLLLGAPEIPDEYSTVTGPDGRFTFHVDRIGDFELAVTGRKVQRQTQWVTAPASVRLVAERCPLVEGEVVDETGTPASRAEVNLWPEATGTQEGPLATHWTDARGRFWLAAPGPGRYRVSAEFRRDDVARTASQGVDVGGNGARVRLQFEAGHTLSGVVVDTRGQPLEELFVELRSPLRSQVLERPREFAGVFTGADGRFTFQDVTGAPLELLIRAPQRAFVCAPRERMHAQAVEPGARDVRLVLARVALVQGRLVRADGSPVTSFTVNGEEQEDEEGRFVWSTHCTATIALELAAPDAVPGSVPVRRFVAVQEGVNQDMGDVVLGGR